MTTEHIVPEEHSGVIGGSTAARRINCPRSLALEARVPETAEESSVYAQEGTTLHELMARILLEGGEPDSYLPFVFVHETEGWECTIDHDLWVEKGAPALAAFDAYIYALEDEFDGAFEYCVENRVLLPGVENAFGTSDVIGRVQRPCDDGGVVTAAVFVIDWKFGRNIVSPINNEQLMFYARGAYNSHTPFTGKLVPDSVVEVAIIQPARQDGPCAAWRLSGARLLSFGQTCVDAVSVAQTKGDAAPVLMGPWCKYARCKSICPLHVSSVEALVVIKSRMAELRAGQGAAVTTDGQTIASSPDWATLYAEGLAAADAVQAWVTEFKTQAHAFATAGNDLPGYKLVAAGGGPRKWSVPDDVVVKYFKNRKFKLDEYMPRRLATMPQGEKLMKARGREIDEHMVQASTSSSTKLVPLAAAGEAVRPLSAVMVSITDKLRQLGGADA